MFSRKAFTLVELLVVVAIIGLLSTVAVVATNLARVNARNAQRKANLTMISKALDLYYSDNGAYPTTGGAYWSVSSIWGSHLDSGSNGWIPNLAPTYMATLPRDPNHNAVNPSSANSACTTNAGQNAYIYISNGTDYKIINHCCPEGALSASDAFVDPARSTYAWAIYTPGGRGW